MADNDVAFETRKPFPLPACRLGYYTRPEWQHAVVPVQQLYADHVFYNKDVFEGRWGLDPEVALPHGRISRLRRLRFLNRVPHLCGYHDLLAKLDHAGKLSVRMA